MNVVEENVGSMVACLTVELVAVNSARGAIEAPTGVAVKGGGMKT